VAITNAGGNVLSPLVAPIRTVPSAPENIRLVAVSTTELGVYWDAPLLTGGSEISKFLIEWDYGPYFYQSNASSFHRVIGYHGAKDFNANANFSFQIDSLATTAVPVYVRVSAMNDDGYYSFAKQAWPLNATMCDTMPVHCSLTPTMQILHQVDASAVALSSADVANRLDVTWTEPHVDYYGFKSITTNPTHHGSSVITRPAEAITTRFEWSTNAEFTNPTVYDMAMLQNNNDRLECPTSCSSVLGNDVQNVSIASNNGEQFTGGKFSAVYVGKHSVTVNVVVKHGSASITVLDTNIVSANIGSVFRIAGDVYQVTAAYANGAYEVHTPFKGGFNDVTVAYHAERPSTCVDMASNSPHTDMQDLLNGITLSPASAGNNKVEVVTQSLNPGMAWLVTFSHAVFQDDVDNIVVFTKSNNELTPPSCATDFTTAAADPYYGATVRVKKKMTAGSLPAGTPVFVRTIPINEAGVGPHKVATVSADGLAIGSIVPRSPPGLPENVHVYQVPSSVGDYLKVTWRKGNEYGGPLIDFVILYQSDNATETSWQSYVVVSVADQSEYTQLIPTEPYCDYLVKVMQRNDQGASGPSWSKLIGNTAVTSITTSIDWTNGTQRAIPTCEYGLDECSEPAYGA